MPFFHYGKKTNLINTNGLILYLDAADLNSYSGSGTTWYDLSGNGNNATIFGTSVWDNTNGGQFDFGNIGQTSEYIVLPHQAAQSTSGSYTLEFWMKPVSSGLHYFSSMSDGVNHNYFILEQDFNSLGLWGGTGSISYSNDEYLQFCVVRDGSDTGKLYKNGVNSTSATNVRIIDGVADGGWILNQEQDSLGGGFSSSQNYRGAFMVIKLYNRALTDQEILQNFTLLKSRYGL